MSSDFSFVENSWSTDWQNDLAAFKLVFLPHFALFTQAAAFIFKSIPNQAPLTISLGYCQGFSASVKQERRPLFDSGIVIIAFSILNPLQKRLEWRGFALFSSVPDE